MNNNPKSYYKILGLEPTATYDEIKKAYKIKAHELHPDKNLNIDTTKEFQFLIEAYEVLIDSVKRSHYDASGFTSEESNTSNNLDPIKCSCCKKTTAQPRYVIFYEVKSFVFVTTRSTVQGIFCPECAQKKVIKPTIITWVIGWWGFPFGILYSLHAIGVNLVGGEKPKDINADILSYQAWYFAQQGQYNTAYSILNDAMKFSSKQKQKDDLAKLKEYLIQQNGSENFKKLKDKWNLFSRGFLLQVIMLLFVIATITILTVINQYNSIQDQKHREQEQLRYDQEHPIQSLPENGAPFNGSQNDQVQYNREHPIKSLPINGTFFKHAKNGKIKAPFKVITEGNDNHFIKMVNVDSGNVELEFFVRAGETVIIKMPIGTYMMKYASGKNWYGKKLLFGKDTNYGQAKEALEFGVDGDRILGHSIELYMKINGNLQTELIDASMF